MPDAALTLTGTGQVWPAAGRGLKAGAFGRTVIVALAGKLVPAFEFTVTVLGSEPEVPPVTLLTVIVH